MGNKNCKPNKIYSQQKHKCITIPQCPIDQVFALPQNQCMVPSCPLEMSYSISTSSIGESPISTLTPTIFSPIQHECISTQCPLDQTFSPNQYQCVSTNCHPGMVFSPNQYKCISTQCPSGQIFSPNQYQCISTQCPSGQTFSSTDYQCICPPGEQFKYSNIPSNNTAPTCYNSATGLPSSFTSLIP